MQQLFYLATLSFFGYLLWARLEFLFEAETFFFGRKFLFEAETPILGRLKVLFEAENIYFRTYLVHVAQSWGFLSGETVRCFSEFLISVQQ